MIWEISPGRSYYLASHEVKTTHTPQQPLALQTSVLSGDTSFSEHLLHQLLYAA